MYTDIVSYKIAKMLHNELIPYEGYKYAAGHVTVTWDNYLGCKEYEKGELITDSDYVHGDYYYAPTYADVLDYLFEDKIIIKLDPCFTYALNNNVAFYWQVLKVDKDNGKLEVLFEDNQEMYSFELAMETIIKKLFMEDEEEI